MEDAHGYTSLKQRQLRLAAELGRLRALEERLASRRDELQAEVSRSDASSSWTWHATAPLDELVADLEAELERTATALLGRRSAAPPAIGHAAAGYPRPPAQQQSPPRATRSPPDDAAAWQQTFAGVSRRVLKGY